MSRKNQWQKKQSQNETKTKSQEKHQPSASQSQPELNKQHVSNENLHHSYAQNNHRTHVPQKKRQILSIFLSLLRKKSRIIPYLDAEK